MKTITITRKGKFASCLMPYWIITCMTKDAFKKRFGIDSDVCDIGKDAHPINRISGNPYGSPEVLDEIGTRILNGKTITLEIDDNVRSIFATTSTGSLSNEVVIAEPEERKLTITTKGGWKTVSYPYFEKTYPNKTYL